MDKEQKNNIFSSRLTYIRKGNNPIKVKYTQEKLSEILGIKRDTYTRYENGTTPPLSTIVNICNIFKVTSDYLLGISDDQQPPTPPPEIIIKYLNHSSDRLPPYIENDRYNKRQSETRLSAPIDYNNDKGNSDLLSNFQTYQGYDDDDDDYCIELKELSIIKSFRKVPEKIKNIILELLSVFD